MKNSGIIKGMFLALTTVVLLASCKKENIDEVVTVIPPAPVAEKIEGDWVLYKREKQALVSVFDGQQIVWSMAWGDYTSSMASEFTMSFFSDMTYEEYYANVLVNSGNWDSVPSNPDEFTFWSPEPTNAWSPLQDIYTVQFWCDSTMSIKFRVEPPAGNHPFQNEEWYEVLYYKRQGTTQCDGLVDYFVD
jgi:hypothetical protein